MISFHFPAVPEILSSDIKDHTVYESLPISYEVRARGIPDPVAQWLHDGEQIKDEPNRVKITQHGDNFKLEIAQVKLEDMGEIKVVILNKVGDQTEAANLKVIRKLYTFFTIAPDKFHIVYILTLL